MNERFSASDPSPFLTLADLTATVDALVDLIEDELLAGKISLRSIAVITSFASEAEVEAVVFRRVIEDLEAPYPVLIQMISVSGNTESFLDLASFACARGDRAKLLVSLVDHCGSSCSANFSSFAATVSLLLKGTAGELQEMWYVLLSHPRHWLHGLHLNLTH